MTRRQAVRQGAVVEAGEVRGTQSEASFQRAVETLAAARGWVRLVLPSYTLRCPQGHAVHWGRSVLPGWPDLALFRPPRKIAWECKSETGKATPEQREMLVTLAACGFEAGVIRPSDMPRIEELLA